MSLSVARTRRITITRHNGLLRDDYVTLGALRPIYTVRFLLTTVACDFYSARCSRHGKIVYDFHDIKLPVATICRRILKHVSKAHDILRVVRDNRKQVVGLIYTE